MIKTVVRLVVLLLILMLLALLIPSSTPLVIAEEASAYPVYTPVKLTAEDVEAIPYDAATPYAPHPDAFLPDDTGYLDPTLSVRIETMRAYDSDIMIAYVQMAHPSQLRAALYRPYPSDRAGLVAQMAKREQAVLAINGDWFMDRKEGYIVRNQAEYKGHPYYRAAFGKNANTEVIDVLVIDENADFHIIPSYNEEKINDFIANSGHRMVHTYSFGPALVIEGAMNIQEELTKLRMNDPLGRAQRIALCQLAPLTYMVVTAEGPQNDHSTGLTVPELAQLCFDLGAETAYNLDGGNSTTIALNYRKINGNVKNQRAVGDIIYFVTAAAEE